MKPAELATQYTKRIDELLAKLDDVKNFSDDGVDVRGVDVRAVVEGCYLGTLTVIESLYGGNSLQAKALFESKKAFTKTQLSVFYELESLARALRGFLLNVREELAADLIRSISTEA